MDGRRGGSCGLEDQAGTLEAEEGRGLLSVNHVPCRSETEHFQLLSFM